MKKIAFFQSDLGVGGIQKSLVNLLSNIDYGKLSVDLYLNEKDRFWSFSFPKELNVIYLPPLPSICKYMPFDLVKKKYSFDFGGRGGYDLAIDFNSYQPACALGALTVPAAKRVMWIHNNVVIKYKTEWKYRILWNFFKGKFKYFDGFTPCSAALEMPFRQLSGISDPGIPFTVIENYIDVSDIRKKSAETVSDIHPDPACMNFIAVGKLCVQKGYDLMLKAFAEACNKRDDLRLYILGDGPDREELDKLRVSLKLEDKVFFLGNKENPYSYMNIMDAYVSTSRYEGQPLNTMEAMVIGLPLYCAKNLEQYTECLKGYEDMAEAFIGAGKEEKHPNDLTEYNKRILDRILTLSGETSL